MIEQPEVANGKADGELPKWEAFGDEIKDLVKGEWGFVAMPKVLGMGWNESTSSAWVGLT